MILPIVKYGDPRLTTPAEEVVVIDDEIKKLVADMVETMHNEPGVGLAANQVGVLKRVAVIDLSVGEDPNALLVLINPKVTKAEGRQCDEEGCLSFPEVSFKITRPNLVEVEALDLNGRPIRVTCEGLLTRALVHEIDHLNGVVIIDHIYGMAKEMVLTKIKRLRRQGNWD
jgi:peptide deformylase